MIVKRIKGIKRPAIATVIPSSTGHYMLIDSGANSECRPEMLAQFGLMGSVYMSRLMGIASPRVAVVNIGTEENKGNDLQIEAGAQLKNTPLNFIGNIEARDIPLGGCDVAVCDGFTGKVILKLSEGLAKMFAGELKTIFMRNVMTKAAALTLTKGVADFKKKLDYSEHGGAMLLGLSKPVNQGARQLGRKGDLQRRPAGDSLLPGARGVRNRGGRRSAPGGAARRGGIGGTK
jgi:glycerol-3-phosphate acyltransferase PlsX